MNNPEYEARRIALRTQEAEQAGICEYEEYRKYQLRWMAEHGHSLYELMALLEEIQAEEDNQGKPLTLLFKEWEYDQGFQGDIWSCFQEFVSCELNG